MEATGNWSNGFWALTDLTETSYVRLCDALSLSTCVQFSFLVDPLFVGGPSADHGYRFHGSLLQQYTTRIRRRGMLYSMLTLYRRLNSRQVAFTQSTVCAIGPVSTALHAIFTKVWRAGHIPADWKDGILTALYKGKGSKKECGNYRPITLLSVPGKVFAHVLLARIQPLLDITRRPTIRIRSRSVYH